MKKQTILLAAGLLFGFAVSAQQITNQSNTVDQSYSLFQTNSPTNTYGNRWDILWLTKNELHIRTPKMFMDSTVGKSLTLTAHPKMSWIDETTGQFKMTIKDSIHWPWDHIVGRPDMSLYYLNSNPSSFISTETDPTVSASIKAITLTNISNWNTAFGWGDHSTQGYLKGIGIISQYFRGDGSLATLPVYNAGTGMSLASGVFTNIMPDQTVSITGTGAASVTNSYPNFTVNVPVNTTSTTIITGSTGISVSGTAPNYTVTNSNPNITPTITAAGSATVISSGNTFTINTPAVATRTMATPARSIVTSTASSGFTISITSDYNVNYSIYAQVSSALVGINTADVYLEISPNNSTWTTISRSGISIQGVLSTSGNTQTVSGFVPASYYVRIRTAATGANSGSAVFTYQNGQENSY